MLIRPALPGDHASIRAVNRAAFGQMHEADLVDALRRHGDVLVELVAVDPWVVGHILFSRLQATAEDGRRLPFAALAPMAVTPARQRQRIGAALVGAGLDACREQEVAAVVVVGWPDYYPRFGFSAGAAERLEAPYAGGPEFMALQLRPGTLVRPYRLAYAHPFDGLNATS